MAQHTGARGRGAPGKGQGAPRWGTPGAEPPNAGRIRGAHEAGNRGGLAPVFLGGETLKYRKVPPLSAIGHSAQTDVAWQDLNLKRSELILLHAEAQAGGCAVWRGCSEGEVPWREPQVPEGVRARGTPVCMRPPPPPSPSGRSSVVGGLGGHPDHMETLPNELCMETCSSPLPPHAY